MRRCLVALLVIAGTAPLARAADPLALLEGCIRRLDPTLDVGFARISQRCPELAPALMASPYAPWLPPDWNRPENALSVGGLSELRMQLSRTARPPAVRAPEVARLAPVLAGLAQTPERPRGWWSRLKDWLRRQLTAQPSSPETGWLQRWFGGWSIGEAARQVILWCAVALALGIAGAIIANELRAAGLLRRSRRLERVRVGGSAAAAPGFAEPEAAGADQQLQLLLTRIAQQLTAQKRLPPARALTVQELVRAAHLSDPADRARLLTLTTACERVRFARGEAPSALVSAALARGRELLVSLTGGAAAGRP
jgi:hypothetical protein